MGRILARVIVVGSVAMGLMLGDVAGANPSPKPVRLPVSMPGPNQVTVVSGDHFWKISDRHLSRQLGREAANEEVSPYWRLVIAANRDTIRSGDPDLIFPGEIITLPPTS